MKKLILVLAICACQSAPHSAPNGPTVAALTAQRAEMIDWLREYYERGIYPSDELGRPISVFKDAHGVRCPMAELIYRSGRGDLVDEVAATNNKLRLADITEGPLYDWMATSGLTIEEIAMVQGAMEFDYSQFQVEPNQQPILARGQVRGRIEMAVTALTKDTKQSIELVANQLAKRPVVKPRAIRRVAQGNSL
jgi:hypothetical protein